MAWVPLARDPFPQHLPTMQGLDPSASPPPTPTIQTIPLGGGGEGGNARCLTNYNIKRLNTITTYCNLGSLTETLRPNSTAWKEPRPEEAGMASSPAWVTNHSAHVSKRTSCNDSTPYHHQRRRLPHDDDDDALPPQLLVFICCCCSWLMIMSQGLHCCMVGRLRRYAKRLHNATEYDILTAFYCFYGCHIDQ